MLVAFGPLTACISGAEPQTGRDACSDPNIAAAIDTILRDDAFILTIGEIHGTEQYPQSVKCGLEGFRGKRILLAYELPTDLNKSIDTSDVNVLRAAISATHLQDGRTSHAAMDLLAYAMEDRNVDLLFTDTRPSVERSDDYLAFVTEADHLAANLIGAKIKSGSYDKVIVYGGNIRMGRGGFEIIGPGGTNLHSWLSNMHPGDVSSINFVSSEGGTFWGCTDTCGVKDHRATANDPSFSEGFDHRAIVGTVGASRPAGND